MDFSVASKKSKVSALLEKKSENQWIKMAKFLSENQARVLLSEKEFPSEEVPASAPKGVQALGNLLI